MEKREMIALDDLSFVGSGLVRPECVVCTAAGRVFASNFDGGVSVVEPGGETWSLLGSGAFRLKPNGICLEEDGSFLIAHLADAEGGVFRLRPDGTVEPFVTAVDGVPLPPTNFVHRDALGRVWITVSTRLVPRMRGYRDDHADGFIALADRRGVRIAADGIGFTNECLLHPDGRRLFVNETFARRVSFFEVGDDGALTNKRLFRELGEGDFPDGMAFDARGDVWITCVVGNRVLRLGHDGSSEVVIEESDPEHIARVETAFRERKMWLEHMKVGGERLRNVSSLAFGGSDLRTVHLGCLLGDRVPCFRSPISGAPPPHWRFAGPERTAR
jgi:sugar lactone lactonase YvrE